MKIVAQHEIRWRAGHLGNPPRIRIVKILKSEGHVLAPLPLDRTQQEGVSIGPIIEKRTLVKRQDARVVSRLAADEEPRVVPKFQKPLKDCDRYPLSAAPFVRSIDDHNLTKLSHRRLHKELQRVSENRCARK